MAINTTTARDKVKDINELALLMESVRAEGKAVVHCHGVFDLLHIGHIRYFEQAKRMGDALVVTVTEDRFVNKGPSRPAFTASLRAEAIAALDCVDFVSVNRWPTAVEPIKLLKPSFYVKGADYRQAENDNTGGIILEREAVAAVGGQMAFTDDITYSASNLINRHLSVFPKDVDDYLNGFVNKYNTGDVVKYLTGASSLKVLVIGETIIDEYHYCETLGKSGK